MQKHYLFLLLALTLAALPALAQTPYSVTTTADSGPGSLRQAIIDGNATSGAYRITITVTGTVSLTAVLPSITQSCTLIGFSTLTPATATGGTTIERNSTAGNFRVLSFTGNSLTVWLQDLILQNGAAVGGEGGALLINAGGTGNVTINHCLIRNSSAFSGGGARIIAGTVTMNDSHLADNTATNPVLFGLFGGALGVSCTTFSANRCTFNGNSARFGGAADSYASQAVFTNCTFSRNTASAGNGRTVYANPSANTDFIQCSFVNNLAISGSAVIANETGTMRVINCLIAGNGGARFKNTIGDNPISLGGNVGDNSADNVVFNQISDKTGVSLSFGPLQQNNGGLIATYSIGDCSPAKDAGVTSSNVVTIPSADANNKPRSGAPDAGAFEVQVPTSVSLTAGNSGTITCVNQVLRASLSGGTSGTYIFAGPGLSATTTSATAVASQQGTYTVIATSLEGCSVSATIFVFANTITPDASFAGLAPSYCSTNNPVTLTPTTAGGQFSGPGISGTTFTPASANGGGTITYSVTGVNGCVNSSTQAVGVSSPIPITLTNNGPIGCNRPTVTLAATPAGQGTFTFSASAVSQGNNTAIVNQTGVYSVTLTSAGGCTSTAQTSVFTDNTLPTPFVATQSTPNGLALQISGGVQYERVKAIDRINGYQIQQTEINSTGYFLIPQPGPYSIAVIGANGCRATVTGAF